MFEWKGQLLRRGDGSSNVRALQTVLTDLGYDTGIDGDFGPKTENAVREIQKLAGLGVDGIVGTKTVNAINEMVFKKKQEQEAKLRAFNEAPSATVNSTATTATATAATAAKVGEPAAKVAPVAGKQPVSKKF